MNIALFDFDGTITETDSYTPFIYFSAPKWRIVICYPLLVPLILLYKLKLIGGSRIRTVVSYFCFFKRSHKAVWAQGKEYASTLDSIIKPEAKQRLAWHKAQGDVIVIVSASLDAYLTPWCEKHQYELICATLASRNGMLTGAYLNGDCSADEKARRVKQSYQLDSFEKVYAYGDTTEDKQLLALADEAYFCWNKVS